MDDIVGLKIQKVENKEQKLVKVATMYFLVHPAYAYDVHRTNESVRAAEALYEKYENIARNLNPNEVLLILPHTVANQPDQNPTASATAVDLLKKINPAQVIVFQPNHLVFSGFDQNADRVAFGFIEATLKDHGYVVDPNTKVMIFGEEYGECVQEAKNGFKNIDFFAEENISIMEDLTYKRV